MRIRMGLKSKKLNLKSKAVNQMSTQMPVKSIQSLNYSLSQITSQSTSWSLTLSRSQMKGQNKNRGGEGTINQSKSANKKHLILGIIAQRKARKTPRDNISTLNPLALKNQESPAHNSINKVCNPSTLLHAQGKRMLNLERSI